MGVGRHGGTYRSEKGAAGEGEGSKEEAGAGKGCEMRGGSFKHVAASKGPGMPLRWKVQVQHRCLRRCMCRQVSP